MKKKILLFLSLVICLCLTACQTSNEEDLETKDDVRNIMGVSMQIKEGTLTNTGATIIITDNNGNKFSYGKEFGIDKKVDGSWQKLEGKSPVLSTMELYKVYEGKLEMEQDWSNIYGKLPKGEYRLVKTTFLNDKEHFPSSDDNQDFAVEFTIE